MTVGASGIDTNHRYEVAIVGLGPTGAALANALGQAGIDTVVLEQSISLCPLPRAAHFDGETLRIFQSLGLLEPVIAISRPGVEGMRFINKSGQTLLVRTASNQPGPHGHINNWYFHQPDLERVLRQGLQRYPSVTTALGHAVGSIKQRSDGVRLLATDRAHNQEVAIDAQYVVGCDGARSVARQSIGADTIDLGFHQAWLCVDLIVQDANHLPEYSVQLCDPARPMTLVNMSGPRRRWEIMLLPDDDPDTLITPISIWSLLERWVNPSTATIERAAIYTFHSLIASCWRADRVLIAGDAAHQTPPFLGQGLCAGIRDAANLAWKLRIILKGSARSSEFDWLASYESERLTHVRTFIELAVKLGKMIQITDVNAAAERDRQFAASGPRLFPFPTPRLGPGALFGEHPLVGTVFAQPDMADGQRLDDVLGQQFALLSRNKICAGLNANHRNQLNHLDVVQIDVSANDQLAQLIDEQIGALILRPDRYVMAVATTSSELAAIIDRLAFLERW